MNWIFKPSNSLKFNISSEKAVAIFEQKKNFTGKEGEDVLLLEKRKEEWQFTAHYRIVSLDFKSPGGEYKQITVNLILVKRFEDEKLLEDYIYSLRRVTNYSSPIKHFNRKYSRITDAEFVAITEDKIYLKRTLVGIVLNALHPIHKKAFIVYAATESPELFAGKIDMDIALKLLLTYMEFAVVKPALYLREASEILRTIVSDNEFFGFGFGLEIEKLTPKLTQMIIPQVAAINEHLKDLLGYSNENSALQIPQIEDDPKFKILFKKTPLPITLN